MDNQGCNLFSPPPPPAALNTKEEKVVEVPDSEDEFEVFNQALSPETSTFDFGPLFSLLIDEMGIQRKQRSSLQ